ncbi:HLA class II histocompatibility antigen, DRB1 beta chain-like isoform X2 [Aquarana catesbeiana]
MNGTQKVRYLNRLFYNQEEFVYFDSDKGYFIPKTEFGRPDAEQYNKDKDFIEQRKAAVQTFCIHNYDIIHSVTADRRVKPMTKISLIHEDPHSEHHMLACNVNRFYPSEIEVKWYRNGEEETAQVQSTDIFQNGDWTFQILVMLETEIEKGDTFTCEVLHSSLETPARVDWHPQESDSGKKKVVTGIVGFVLGTMLIIAGVVVYMRGRKAQMLFRGPQTEHFIHT